MTVSVEPTTAEVAVGQKTSFSAAVQGTADLAVIWSVAEGAAGGQCSASGLYTAPSSAGTFHVVVTSHADPTKSATATAQVTSQGTLAVTPSPVTVPVLGSQQFAVSPAVAVTWRVEPAAPVAFPLKVAAGARTLADQGGVPFRIHGDAGWSLISNLTLQEAELYLADRKARGFNTVLVNLLEHKFAARAPANRNGDYPFTAHTAGSYDFSTPNEAYFAFADSVLDLAAAKGLLVLLDVMYTGNGGGDEGWWSELSNGTNSNAKLYAYGQFLGNRYKNRSNLLWVISGDFTPSAGSQGEARLLQMVQGMRDAGATQLMTSHDSPGSVSTDWSAFAASDALRGVYPSAVDTATPTRNAYRAGGKPVYLLEPGYEDEGWVGGGTAKEIRAYEWWAQLAGIGGVLYGQRDTWPFNSATWNDGYPFNPKPWTQSLGRPGTVAMGHMAALLASIPWQKLEPSGLQASAKTLVTAGAGSAGSSYVSAAATSDGTWLLAYVPYQHSGSITIDMTAMSGTTRARWWDPTAGTFTAIATGLANSGTHAFTPPGNNAGGDADWLLVLDSGTTASCGTIDASGLYAAPAAVPSPGACHVVATQVSNPSVTAYATVTVSP